MKRFIIITIIVFGFFSKSLANDISDFQIEGLYVGESLLDYASLKKIKASKSKQQFPNDKYIIYLGEKLIELKTYEYLNIDIKKNDKKFTIVGLSGIKPYNTLEECNNLKNEIQSSLEKIFNFNSKDITKYPSKQDKTGKSMVYGIQNYLKPYPSLEAININCYHFAGDKKNSRNLQVSINSEEFAHFLINDAYKEK